MGDLIQLPHLRAQARGEDTRLRRLRTAQRLSQREVAEEIGVAPLRIRHYENGKAMVLIEHQRRLAMLFGVSVAHLMGEDLQPEWEVV